MTDKLHCPFCGAELEKFGGGDFPMMHYCDNTNCNLYHIMGQYTLWQELIRTRKALGIAWDGLKKIGSGNIIEHSVVGHENDSKIFIANKTLDESKTALG